MEPVSLTATTAKLVYTGACLAVGFYIGKKLTNKIDYWIFTHSKEFEQFVKSRKATEPVPEV